jgi:phosphatidate cytidylyltransferase
MKSLLIRTATGIVFIALIITAILFSDKVLFNVFLLFTGIALYEYRTLLLSKQIHLSILFYVVALAIYLILSYVELWQAVPVRFLLLLMVVVLLLLFVVELFRKEEHPFTNIAYSFLGIVWIVLPFSLLNHIPLLLPEGKYVLFALFIFVWMYDTFAYCIGSLIGRHRLMERVSPKKSWEGAIGAAILTLCFAIFAPKIFGMLPFTLLQWVFFALIVVVIGTIGDLLESLFKRQLSVKDSGFILPGHGGILDRFDSVLFILPFIFFYLLCTIP